MNTDLSIIHLISGASLTVQLIMLLLVVISLFSWTIIFRKIFSLRAARTATEEFEADFWKDRDLGSLYQQVRDGRRGAARWRGSSRQASGEYLKSRQQKDSSITPSWSTGRAGP